MDPLPRIDLSSLDLILIAAYFVALMVAGFASLRGGKRAHDWFLAGRTLTVPAFVATLVATWYGGILGIGEYAWQSGLSVWLVLGVPYYLFAALYAWLLAPRIRAAGGFTIPDKVAETYGKASGAIAGLFTYCLATPAPYVLILGLLLQLICGWSLPVAMAVGLLLSTVYVYVGGFRSDVRVNLVQFVLMFAGIGLMLPWCLREFGGLDYLRANLPATHLVWHGGNTPQYIVAWFFIALWTFVDPSFHQRCSAAATPATAQRGVLISIGFWLLFDFLTCTAGLYARAALPDIEPLMAYPLLAERVLPSGAKGLFYIGMLATVMSTVVSTLFLSGVTFARDFVYRLSGGDPDTRVRLRTALGLILTSLLAMLLALKLPSVVKLWYVIGTVFIPGLLLPVLSAYWPRLRTARAAAPVAMLGAVATSVVWLALGARNAGAEGPVYPLGIEPMYPGLAVSFLVFGIGGLGRRRGEV